MSAMTIGWVPVKRRPAMAARSITSQFVHGDGLGLQNG